MREKIATLAALAVLVVMTSAGPAAATAKPRVVGGSPLANPGWVALVIADFGNGDSGQCDGQLISTNWVLTAAHCVMSENGSTPLSPSSIKPYVGIDRASQAKSGNAQAVDRVVVNPAYNATTSTGDLALVHLSAADSHPPVALGSAGDPAVGSTPVVLGFGVTNSVTGATSDQLLQVNQPVLNGDFCAQTYPANFDRGTEICAGGTQGQDSCEGDSGGPLAFAPSTPAAVLVGTVDYGPTNCGNGAPAVYQAVTGGPGSTFISATAPTAGIVASRVPPPNGTVGLTATAGNLSSPSFTWDLDGNGLYGEATGPTAITRVGAGPVSIGVRAVGSDGQQAARRLTVTPAQTTVTPTAPASVREGSPLRIALATAGPGNGALSVRATGSGVAATGQVALPASELLVTLPSDRTWRAPRTLTLALTATDGAALSTQTLTTRLIDDDKPKLRLSSVKRRSTSVVATVRAPGSGTTTLKVVRRGKTIARRTLRSRSTKATRATVKLSRSARRLVARGGARVSGAWRSSSTPVVRAAAHRSVPR